MDQKVARRSLDLSDLDAVIRDAESLLAHCYDKAGHWDLAQVCGHVTDWMSYPLDGFPTSPLPIQVMLWLMRVTVGKRKLRAILETRSISSNSPTLPKTIPASGGDEAAAVARLGEVVRRLCNHAGSFHASPVFGDMDHETLIKLNVTHATHHLSFLVPKR
jgi:hypothetical protein